MYLASIYIGMEQAILDPRQARGLALAKNAKIKKLTSRFWLVPSQTSKEKYVVDPEKGTCSCPDHETRQVKCKHQWALEYARHEVTAPDGSTVVSETLRITYAQDWPRYNAAQQNEKAEVEKLLRALCEGVSTPAQKGPGRRYLPLSDVVFGMTMKVYTTVSGRRATTDIRECAAKKLIDVAPHYNTLFVAMEKPELTPILTGLVEESASPLVSIESTFAPDSTGFSTSNFARWFDHKYGGDRERERKEHTWVKMHAIVGCKTNVITGVKITNPFGVDTADARHLAGLVETTAKRFSVDEVVADKAYLSRENLEKIDEVGARAFIPMKENSKAGRHPLWNELFHYYNYRRPDFLAHYHARSNVEATFSMIKRKFGDRVRSKLFVAQVNELLCKSLCHNLAVLVHSFHELGVESKFWKDVERT